MSVFHVAVTILFVFNLIPSGIFQAATSSEKCTRQGSFEIVDGTCQNYYMCIFNGVQLVSYEFKCASSTVFSPVTGYCTPSAQYPCTQTTALPTSTVSAPGSSSPATTAPGSSSPATTAPGSSSPTTTAPGSSSPATTAPGSSSPATTAPGSSSPTTTAPVSSSSTVPTTSTAATTTTKPTCLTTGRFPISGSSCKMYYYCYVDGTNIINYTNLTCPTILVFNPIVQKCVLPTTYSCTS